MDGPSWIGIDVENKAKWILIVCLFRCSGDGLNQDLGLFGLEVRKRGTHLLQKPAKDECANK